MEITVDFLDNLRLEAKFDDFSIIADQPIRYKGDGTAPSPFDYFLASSALCAAYFIKVYCLARDIPTDDIRVSQNNIIDPENRYAQMFQIQVELPSSISEKDRIGILRSADRCTVKKVIQQGPDFKIDAVEDLDAGSLLESYEAEGNTMILGKDLPLEQTISNMTKMLADVGVKIEVASWRNIVPNVWSLNIREAASPMCFTNGKGATQESALCSALGEYIERMSCNFFYNDYFFGEEIADAEFVHYPNEKWFKPGPDDAIPEGLLDEHCLEIYNPDGELKASNLIDTNSGRADRGIVALPFTRSSDQETVYFPSNLLENLFVSNGMSAGNNLHEAKVQCLSEIFERAIKRQVLEQEITLPDVPKEVLAKYPSILAGIEELEEKGFPIIVKDASLGGKYPVMCVTLMNPKTSGVFASFGAHPSFEVALERSLTELMQGRSFEGLNDVPPPTFNSHAVSEPNNFVEHFIDSTGLVSWRFFSEKHDYEFCEWDFSGTNEEENATLMGILEELGHEVYVATYEDFGASACRILVPGYSEVYGAEDLIWDNTNKSLKFREDILNIHSLDDDALNDLLERLEESEEDNYTLISDLIGIVFDENTVWGKLDVGELKIMLHLALGQFEEAKEIIVDFLNFNDNTVERILFYRAMSAVVDIAIEDDLELDDYLPSLTRMYGPKVMEQVVGSVTGEVKFSGLTKTSMKLEGLDKHLRMIESYQKLHSARAKNR
ncbi:OsmC domain/YcaO domain-containing protein [Sneathiella sp. P13V-1]|uniref:OsmC domain/YcaO domain-containing protein n=1 Tax=Sneathiella sp. P13V-1 TaxID=2697366 RepID=UPI00187B6E4E|nr:OsmC domain/YcaO domain-containing protein [Sneathiella sp. P13V-1]MBE7637758.1 OsmC domain/YcaO domain-containing protein [Sneathiella sp. P13V-1]